MIIATIQSPEGKATQIVAVNGKLVSDEEKQKYIKILIDEIFGINTDGEGCITLKNGKKFCYMYHPIKDHLGRTRQALIIFDDKSDYVIIKATIEIMGLSFEKFEQLRNKIKNKNAFMLGGFVLMAIVLVILYFITKD